MIYLFMTAYLLGSLSPAYLIVKRRLGQDIRETGSRNAGATNAARLLGFWWGVLVLVLDAAKGSLAILLARYFFGEDAWTLFAAAFGVVIGHNWPVTLRFRGGRGVAPYVGVWLAIAPVLAVLALIVAGLSLLLTRLPTVMIAAGIIAFNTLMALTGQPLGYALLCLALSGFLVAVHLMTVRRRLLSAVRSRRWRDVLRAE
jgi:glycerol-3-phosphate acyltransferase PlsY